MARKTQKTEVVAPVVELTAAEKLAQSTERMVDFLKKNIEGSEVALAKFKKDLEINPVHAFEWAHSAFEAAAELSIMGCYLKWLTDPESKADFNSLVKHATERAINGARYGAHSTSGTSNIMKTSEFAVYARIVEEARWM